MANAETFGWTWEKFRGSREALKWNRRDLPCLDAVIARVPGRTAVIQAGGNLGMWPKRLAETFATVYTFEPAADLFAIMMHNAPAANIIRFQAALGDVPGLIGMSRVRRDGKPNPHEGITHVSGHGVIPTLRIDDLHLPICDLIYLDVEGWELYALRGALETIARCRPVLAIEINKSAALCGIAKADVRSLVLASGYRFVERLSSDDVFVPAERAA
jgi:FkbM family methyltransferase